MARRISAANAPVSPTEAIAGWLATIRSTSVVPVRGSPAEHRRGGGITRRGGGHPASRVGLDDPVDLGDFGRGIVRDRTVLQIAAGFGVIEGARVPIQVLAFLAEREAQHGFAGLRQPAIADQRFHFRDMVAIGGLDAQVRAQIVGKTVAAVECDGGVAMRFGVLQRPGHPLGRREIEQILRHIGTGGDRPQEEFLGSLMQAQQAEDRTQCVLRFRRIADNLRGGFGGLEGAACLTGNKQAFCAQNERNRILRHQGDRAIGADDGRVGTASLQRGFCQKRPGTCIVRRARHQLRANPFRRRHIAIGEGAPRLVHGSRTNSVLGRARQAVTP